MFILKSSRNDYSYMNCHSDDVELLTTSPTDAGEIIEKFQNQYGVKMADSSYMLGLNRDEITVDGVKTIQITQDAYITELYEVFKDEMPTALTPMQRTSATRRGFATFCSPSSRMVATQTLCATQMVSRSRCQHRPPRRLGSTCELPVTKVA